MAFMLGRFTRTEQTFGVIKLLATISLCRQQNRIYGKPIGNRKNGYISPTLAKINYLLYVSYH